MLEGTTRDHLKSFLSSIFILIILLFLKSFSEFPARFLIAGFVEKSKHVFLIGFNPGLVEWIDIENITAYCTGQLKEIKKLSDIVLGKFRDFKLYYRNVAIVVGKYSPCLSIMVNFRQSLSCKIIELIGIIILVRYGKGPRGD